MLDRLLDHKADEHFFEEVHAPIFDLCIELLRRNIEKVSQLLGVVEPEKVRKSSRHEHLERDEIALAKLVMKEGEKPGKFLLPHGIILLELGPYRIFMEGNPEGIQNQRPLGIMALSVKPLAALVGPDCADTRPDFLALLVFARAFAMVEDKRWCIRHSYEVTDTTFSVGDWERVSMCGGHATQKYQRAKEKRRDRQGVQPREGSKLMGIIEVKP